MSTTEARKVHVLDDNRQPDGPMLCGKTSVLVLGGALEKGDVLCRKCAMTLLSRSNDRAAEIEILVEEITRAQDKSRELRMKVLRKDRMLVDLLERFLDQEPALT